MKGERNSGRPAKPGAKQPEGLEYPVVIVAGIPTLNRPSGRELWNGGRGEGLARRVSEGVCL